MEEFVCGKQGCGYRQERQSLERGRLPVHEWVLWAAVAAGKSHKKDQCEVQCPECLEPHKQCLHCKFSFLVDDNDVLKRNGRTAEGCMNKHLRQKHKTKNKRCSMEMDKSLSRTRAVTPPWMQKDKRCSMEMDKSLSATRAVTPPRWDLPHSPVRAQ